MGLREQAASDLRMIVEDEAGFGWPIEVTDPGGTTATLVGLSTDIALTIDPQTGQQVSGRMASVAITIASLRVAGFTELPRNVTDKGESPWLVRFLDINGTAHQFKVSEASPDRAVGIVICALEAFRG